MSVIEHFEKSAVGALERLDRFLAAARDGVFGPGVWTTSGMLKACGVLFVILSLVFLTFPKIDLWVAELFYNGNNDFWLRKSLLTAWKNAYIRPAVGILAVLGLIYYLYRRLTDPACRIAALAKYGFFLLCVAVATGLVVHAVFKDNWGRARPKHVTEFDGQLAFSPPLIPVDQCERNCSFVSGDASMGFVFLALALFAAQRRKMWILITVGAGLGLGALRVMNGSHFLSDILFAGVFTCGTVLLLYRWMIEGKWRDDRRWARRAWDRALVLAARHAPADLALRVARGRVRIRRLLRWAAGGLLLWLGYHAVPIRVGHPKFSASSAVDEIEIPEIDDEPCRLAENDNRVHAPEAVGQQDGCAGEAEIPEGDGHDAVALPLADQPLDDKTH